MTGLIFVDIRYRQIPNGGGELVSTVETMRERQLLVRLNAEEFARAEAVANHYGVSAANTVRLLFKEKSRELGLEVAQPAPKKPAKGKAK